MDPAIDKAIILAAGLGSRLGMLTSTIPKCLIKVKGKPILINTLDNLANCGIKEAVIVVGYLGEKIKEKIGWEYRGIKINYVKNEIYDKTNNIYSLWLVRNWLEKGAVLVEGDSFFEEAVLQRLLETDERSYWAADKFDLFKDGCMLTSGEGGVVRQIEIIRGAQDREFADNHHKSGDLIKIMPDLGEQFSEWLDREVRVNNVNSYYDLVLAKYMQEGQLFVCNINGLKWMEIDDYEDLRKAERVFGGTSRGVFERKYEVVPIETLKPLERVFPNHLNNLNELILKEGVIKAPLLVDKNTGIVLDGSHRYIFFLQQGYKTVPVHYVDYQDEHIRVGTHLLHRHLIVGKTDISKAEVVERGLSGQVFPPRTTRHFFPFRKIDDMNLPLSSLEKGEPQKVDELIEPVGTEEEIKHNEGFIREIEQEMDELVNYMYEARQVKSYLQFQVEEMKRKSS